MNRRLFPALLALLALAGPGAFAQGRGGGGAGAPQQSGRAGAIKDVTGYWVSVVAEHWHLRMLVPPKGDVTMLPVNAEARRITNTWDPAKDEASGEACRSYGAPTIMRVPGRLHITWQDDNTLKIDTDAGTQTRLLHFGGASPTGQAPSWQGYSAATWRRPVRVGSEKNAGDLRVVTNRLRPGYLRKNGVPYSENATVEEFFDAFTEPNGDSWLVIDTIVTDSTYLTQPYVNSVAFRKQRDASGWDPTPCRVDQPR
ncbi:MAG TPA: hypothetical protein VEP46_05265 [Vicinamibacterales bacterium]|nr:hypothetical protein [Vicinamibacterales bacterium]